eukprot:jgi/Psemu1/42140/gm1.42140_g
MSEPYLSTFTRPARLELIWGQAVLEFTQDGFSNHLVVQRVLNKHMQHQAVMKNEFNTHLEALKKEQEDVMKELRSLKSRVDKEQKKQLPVSVLLRTFTEKKLKPMTRAGRPNDLFQEYVEVTLEEATKSVGVVLETYPTWLRYVGLYANALWLNSQFDIPGHGPKDPPWTKLDVGAIAMDLPLGKHNRIVLPGWKSGSTLGGITDGWFLVKWANQVGGKPIDFILPPAIQTTLHQILFSRAHNDNFVAEKGTRTSLLHLNSQGMWVSRQITVKELEAVHDFPSGRVNRTHDERVLGTLIDHETPSKLNLNWGRVTELTATTNESYKQNTHVTGREASFDAEILKAKAKDGTNAILDKAMKIVEASSQEWSDQPEPPLNLSEPDDLPQFKWALRKLGAFCLTLRKQKNADWQSPYSDPNIKALIKEKASIVIDKGYIKLADIEFVEAMMFMFHVLKGKMDVRIVDDGTKSGLNNTLHTPWFSLPTMMDSMLQWVEILRSRPLSVASFSTQRTWHNRVWMHNAIVGLKPFPYNSEQGSLQAKCIVLGYPRDLSNPYVWDWVCPYFSGMESYDPTQPLISKLRSDRLQATKIMQYVEDVQITGIEGFAWECSSKIVKGLCWLCLHDACVWAQQTRGPHSTACKNDQQAGVS